MNSVELSVKLNVTHDMLLTIINNYSDEMCQLDVLNKQVYYKNSKRPRLSYDLTPYQVVLTTLYSKSNLLNVDILQAIGIDAIDSIYNVINASKPITKSTEGYLYCVVTPNNTKIGRTVSPEKRIKTIVKELEYTIDDVQTYISPISINYISTAVKLFRVLAGRSLSNGWFTINYEDAKFEIQRAICDSNRYNEISCEDDCVICDECRIAFNNCVNVTHDKWLSGMMSDGLSECQAKRWYDIHYSLGN